MNIWLKQNWLILLLILLPVILGLAVYEQLPAELPTHWNARGAIDGTMPKLVALLVFPIIMLFSNAIFWALPYIDPKKSLANSQRPLQIIQISTTMLISVLSSCTIFIGLGYELDIPTIVPIGVLLLFLVLGNYMGKIRPNAFMGIRTPWTMKNDKVWHKTHRLSGWIWVGMSLGLIGVRFLISSEIFIYLFIIGVAVMVLIPVIYSYLLARETTD